MTKKDKTLTCIDESGARFEFYALDKAGWREYRRSTGDEKGEPLVIPNDRFVGIRFPVGTEGKQLRIYYEVGEE
jgi:hypothetical protein